MKKQVKIYLSVIAALIVIGLTVFFIISKVKDENNLTVAEKRWINNNISTVQNINLANDLDVFSKNGKGIFYDFVTDFGENYNLKINLITATNTELSSKNGFKLTHTLDDNSIVMYEDNYVLISPTYQLITTQNNLNNLKVGVISSDYDYISSYIKDQTNISYERFDSKSALEKAIKSGIINFIIVPKYEYIDFVITNNYQLLYNFSDIKSYFVYEKNDNDNLGTIIRKYYNKWTKTYFDKTYNKQLLNTLTSALNLSDADMKAMTSKVYNYGFINNSPYEVIMGGNYGGIVGEYLRRFSNMANIDFKFIKYNTLTKFNNALTNNDIDLYFNYYNYQNSYTSVPSYLSIKYTVIAKETNSVVINSIQSLKYKTVYVLQDSILYNYLTTLDNITIKTYRNNSELFGLVNKDNIIVLDSATYEYYANTKLKGYNSRYSANINDTYSFKLRDTGSFYQLFSKFIMLQDPNEVLISGIHNHNVTIATGSFLGSLAKYTLYIILGAIIILYILYRRTKRVKITKKIKKEEKIKYIDQLTSLKNRNYLQANMDAWNKNTIYPQATIVIDLNKIQEINDTLGYEKGDQQIKAAANILIKNQIDNTDIMRTDGNEFLIYLVGYDKTQVIAYMRKLSKEFKNLPYEYGAEMGYSIITDDLKSIEDAINEAVDDMKTKKEDQNS